MATEYLPSPSLPSFQSDLHPPPAPPARYSPTQPKLNPSASIDLTGESDGEDEGNAQASSSTQARIPLPQTSTRPSHITLSPSNIPHRSFHPNPQPSHPSLSPFSTSPYQRHRPTEEDVQFTGSNMITPPYIPNNPMNGHRYHPNGSGISPGQMYQSQNILGSGAEMGWSSNSALRPPIPSYNTMGMNGPSPSPYATYSTPPYPMNNDIQTHTTWTAPPGREKKVICIGAVNSTVTMLYTAPAAEIGMQPLPGVKERYTVVQYRGAETLKVKLKVSKC
jgi:hypothetical protein